MAPHDRFVLEVPVEPADEVVRFSRRRWSHGEKLREPAGGAALAHVSIAPALASRRAREELAGICGSIDRFHFELNAVRTFAGGIVYLAPSPAEPFRELMRGCGADPSRSEPHVTLAFGAEAAELAALKRYVAPLLPIRSDAVEAHLVLLQARRRELVARLPFSD